MNFWTKLKWRLAGLDPDEFERATTLQPAYERADPGLIEDMNTLNRLFEGLRASYTAKDSAQIDGYWAAIGECIDDALTRIPANPNPYNAPVYYHFERSIRAHGEAVDAWLARDYDLFNAKEDEAVPEWDAACDAAEGLAAFL